jgi:hypothetical protein
MTNVDGNQTSCLSCDPERIPARIKILIAVHLVLGMTQSMTYLFPLALPHDCMKSIFNSITFAQLMLLSLWLGMGTGSNINRLLVSLLGVVYITFWPTIRETVLRPGYMGYHGENPLHLFFFSFYLFCSAHIIFSGIFLFINKKWIELKCISKTDNFIQQTRFQYSIIHLLIITFVVALVLSLSESADISNSRQFFWQDVTIYF